MNLLMKYSLPFPVTIVRVVVITSSVRGFVHVCGFSSNKPRSRAFCVGWFRAVPTLHKYSLSRNHWKSRISPKSTPFCFRIFASSSIPHDDGELMMAVANVTFGACASICFCWLSIVPPVPPQAAKPVQTFEESPGMLAQVPLSFPPSC